MRNSHNTKWESIEKVRDINVKSGWLFGMIRPRQTEELYLTDESTTENVYRNSPQTAMFWSTAQCTMHCAAFANYIDTNDERRQIQTNENKKWKHSDQRRMLCRLYTFLVRLWRIVNKKNVVYRLFHYFFVVPIQSLWCTHTQLSTAAKMSLIIAIIDLGMHHIMVTVVAVVVIVAAAGNSILK